MKYKKQYYGLIIESNEYINGTDEIQMNNVNREYPTIDLSICYNLDEEENEIILEENEEGKCCYTDKGFSCSDIYNNKILITKDRIFGYNKDRNIKAFLDVALGPAIILEEYLHNRIVLHASAFAINKKAYLILAPSGYGKSTLCSAMVEFFDCKLVTDDIAVISPSGEKVYAGDPILRLLQDSYENLQRKDGIVTDKKFNKYEVVCDNGDKKLPAYEFDIGGLIFLESKETEYMDIERVRNSEEVMLLLKNIKLHNILHGKYFDNIMSVLSKLLRVCAGYKISLKRDYNLLYQQSKTMKDILMTGKDRIGEKFYRS